MPQNPTLNTPGFRAPTPVVGDDRALLGALQQGAQLGVKIAHDKVIDNFKQDLTTAVDTAIKRIPGLADIDAQVAAEGNTYDAGEPEYKAFSRRIELLKIAQAQGVMSAGQAMIEAEKVVRDATRRRPELAQEFQREATLLTGSNPIGATLQSVEAFNTAQAKGIQEEMDNIRAEADKLGVPSIYPINSPEFIQDYLRRKSSADQKEAWANYYTVMTQSQELDAPAMAAGAYRDMNRTFTGLIQPALDKIGIVNGLSPEQKAAWLRGELDIGFTRENIIMDAAKVKDGIQEIYAYLPSGLAKTQASGTRDFYSELTDNMLEMLRDPNADFTLLEAQVKAYESRFFLGQPNNVRDVLAGSRFASPILATLGPYPSDEILRRHIIEWVTTGDKSLGGGFTTRGFTDDARGWASVVSSDTLNKALMLDNPNYSSDPNGDMLKLKEHLDAFKEVRQRTRGLNIEINPEAATRMLVSSTQIMNYLNDSEAPPQDLINDMLSTFTDDMFLEVAMNTSPELQAEVKNSWQEFQRENLGTLTQQIDQEMRNTFTLMVDPAQRRGQGPVRGDRVMVGDVIEPVLDDISNGNIIFRFSPDAADRIHINSVRRVGPQLERWGSLLSNVVKTQANIQVMGTGKEPDYLGTYRAMISRGGFGGGNFPIADILSQVNVE